MTRSFNIIVCVDSQFGFSKNGKIPWHFKADMQRFKTITDSHYCIMGRNTYDEIFEKRKDKILNNGELLLPNRTSIVLSRNPEFTVSGATKESALRKAIDLHCTDDAKSIFILGGEKLFIETLPFVSKIYLTFIEGEFKCDQFFNLKYLDSHFTIESGEKIIPSKKDSKKIKNAYFLTLRRVK